MGVGIEELKEILVEENESEETPRSHRKKCSCLCEICQRDDCGKCKYCLDMPKFGGLGKFKKRCEKRMGCLRERGKTKRKKRKQRMISEKI